MLILLQVSFRAVLILGFVQLLTSHLKDYPSKTNKIYGTLAVGETRTNSSVTFFYGPLRMYLPVLADQQEAQLCADTGFSLENLPRAIDDRDRWGERIRKICALSTTWWWWWWWYYYDHTPPTPPHPTHAWIERKNVVINTNMNLVLSEGLRIRWSYLPLHKKNSPEYDIKLHSTSNYLKFVRYFCCTLHISFNHPVII